MAACVVLRCEDVLVAIPQHILVKESTFFNAKFARWQKTGNEKEGQELDENNIDEDVDAQQDENSDGPSAKRAKYSESETAQVIGIKGYIPEAVKLLFESIQGNKAGLQNCEDVNVLGDVLLLCDFYGITCPERLNLSPYWKFRPSLDNDFFKCFKVADKLEKVDSLKPIAEKMKKDCIFLAEGESGFLNTAKKMKKFVLDNRDNTELVHKLLQSLNNIEDERLCQECHERKICLTCYKSSRGGNSSSPERRRRRGSSSPPRSGLHLSRRRVSRNYLDHNDSPVRSNSRASTQHERSVSRSRSRSNSRRSRSRSNSRRSRSRTDSRRSRSRSDSRRSRSRSDSRRSRSRSNSRLSRSRSTSRDTYGGY